MPIHFKIIENTDVLYVEFCGNLSVQEIATYIGDSRSLDPLRTRELLNMISVGKVALRFNDIESLSKIFNQSSKDSFPTKIAMVVSSDFHFGLARMFQMLSEKEGTEISIFRDMNEAVAWIDVALPDEILHPSDLQFAVS